MREAGDVVRAPAPAKINLTLHVAAPKEPGGLHPLRSLVVFADRAGDLLEARLSDTLSLALQGPFAPELAVPGGPNLVIQAAQALAGAAGIPAGAQLRLEKALPVASGIGGGSADAAAALRALNRLWKLDWPLERLAALAAKLGSDVPACLACEPVWMAGFGAELAPVPGLAPLEGILVNPGIACPTGPVYRAFDAAGQGGSLTHPDEPAGGLRSLPSPELASWLGIARNDLEAAAVQLVPEIGTVLAVLASTPGVALARMSGSGATCFALLTPGASVDLDHLRARLPTGSWIQPTGLGGVAVS